MDEPSGAEDVASPQKDEVAPATTSAGKTKIAGLYKPPTHEELQNLKETENLYQSNLIRLQVRGLLCAPNVTGMNDMCSVSQITELLAEVKPKKSAMVDEFLHQLRDVLMSLPSLEPVDVSSFFLIFKWQVEGYDWVC